jgi:hypothetical protein
LGADARELAHRAIYVLYGLSRPITVAMKGREEGTPRPSSWPYCLHVLHKMSGLLCKVDNASNYNEMCGSERYTVHSLYHSLGRTLGRCPSSSKTRRASMPIKGNAAA